MILWKSESFGEAPSQPPSGRHFSNKNTQALNGLDSTQWSEGPSLTLGSLNVVRCLLSFLFDHVFLYFLLLAISTIFWLVLFYSSFVGGGTGPWHKRNVGLGHKKDSRLKIGPFWCLVDRGALFAFGGALLALGGFLLATICL